MTAKGSRYPDVIIIGAQKCATTSFYHYLCQHEQIIGSFKKELHFFDNDRAYRNGSRYYQKQFPKTLQSNMLIEATPNYVYYEKVADRIAEYDFSPKFICAIRHPLKRAYSAWNMYKELKATLWFRRTAKKNASPTNDIYNQFITGEFPTFQDSLQVELEKIIEGSTTHEPSLIARGFYLEQLSYWISKFNRDQFFFVQQEDLIFDESTITVLEQILKFLGISDKQSFVDQLNLKQKNKRSYVSDEASKLSKEFEQQLMDLFSERNEGLAEMTGLHIKWLK